MRGLRDSEGGRGKGDPRAHERATGPERRVYKKKKGKRELGAMFHSRFGVRVLCKTASFHAVSGAFDSISRSFQRDGAKRFGAQSGPLARTRSRKNSRSSFFKWTLKIANYLGDFGFLGGWVGGRADLC